MTTAPKRRSDRRSQGDHIARAQAGVESPPEAPEPARDHVNAGATWNPTRSNTIARPGPALRSHPRPAHLASQSPEPQAGSLSLSRALHAKLLQSATWQERAGQAGGRPGARALGAASLLARALRRPARGGLLRGDAGSQFAHETGAGGAQTGAGTDPAPIPARCGAAETPSANFPGHFSPAHPDSAPGTAQVARARAVSEVARGAGLGTGAGGGMPARRGVNFDDEAWRPGCVPGGRGGQGGRG